MKIIEPIATNNLNTKLLYESRKFYREKAYDETYTKPLDVWYENSGYGKLDLDGDVVYPMEKETMGLLNIQAPKFAIDFVADAFNDFKDDFEALSVTPVFRTNSKITLSEPKRTWNGSESYYMEYLSGLRNFFIDSVLAPRHEDIRDFQSFLYVIMKWVKSELQQPLTRTAFTLSPLCPILTTGLVIELSLEQHDNDILKNTWIEDVNFGPLVTLANKYGFYIDKNAPWRLVANLASDKMKEYMRPYLINKDNHLKNFFTSYFDKSWLYDLDYLRYFLVETYNRFAAKYPVYRDGCNFIRKPFYNTKDVNRILDKFIWLSLYLEIRFKEVGKEITRQRKMDLLEEIQVALKYYGFETALAVINEHAKK